jgi:2'-5' RNA ligase
MSEEPPHDGAPLILTLALDTKTQERLDRLRAAHFPAERNYLRAHLTLFHHLPAADEATIRADLTAVSATHAPLTLRAAEVRFFGQGVAYGFAAPELGALRDKLARQWRPLLNEQDRRPFRPHVTVQNKVPAAQARTLYDALGADFAPFTIGGRGSCCGVIVAGRGRLRGRIPSRPWGMSNRIQLAAGAVVSPNIALRRGTLAGRPSR